MTLAEAARIAGSFLASLGLALGLTLIIELAVAAGVFGLRAKHEFAVIALASIATNPALNIILTLTMALIGRSSLADPPMPAILAALEILVVLVEWRLIAWALPDRRNRAFFISLTMNATSLVAGLLLFGGR